VSLEGINSSRSTQIRLKNVLQIPWCSTKF